MSIKRGKQVNYRPKDRGAPSSGPFAAKQPEKELTWAEHMEGKDDAAFVPYSLSSTFAKGALIEHPKFGKGVVTGVEGAKIEVCFEAGSKKLSMAV